MSRFQIKILWFQLWNNKRYFNKLHLFNKIIFLALINYIIYVSVSKLFQQGLQYCKEKEITNIMSIDYIQIGCFVRLCNQLTSNKWFSIYLFLMLDFNWEFQCPPLIVSNDLIKYKCFFEGLCRHWQDTDLINYHKNKAKLPYQHFQPTRKETVITVIMRTIIS